MSIRKGSGGGKVMAVVQRKKALEQYYSNPNVCLNCNKVIEVFDNQKVSEVKKKEFCNHSCSANYNNKKKGFGVLNYISKGNCEICGIEIEFKRMKNGSYHKRKYCKKCLQEIRAKNRGANTYIVNLTKSQVFGRYSKYYIGRSMIRKHAKMVFDRGSKEKKCFICGYDKHVDIAHIKNVSDFEGSTLMSVINNIDNLVGLCPNHHWEYDNGKIDLKNNCGAASSSAGPCS